MALISVYPAIFQGYWDIEEKIRHFFLIAPQCTGLSYDKTIVFQYRVFTMSQLRDVFVSHSHHDKDAVKKLVKGLQPEFDIYVDLNDPMLVDIPSEKIAKRLLNKILHCRVLLFVLSVKAINSRWMPWELGIAHGRVGRILLWPLTPAARRALKKQEYLHLYDVVDAKNPEKTLRAVVKKARSELISDAMAETARLMGVYATELTKHVPLVKLPGKTADASTNLASKYTSGMSEVRDNDRKI